MTDKANLHIPVLLNEAIAGLDIKADGRYVDLTFGAGGHSREILKRLSDKGMLLGVDRDEVAISAARELNDPRLIICHRVFSELSECMNENIWQTGSVDGVLIDLGASSMQFDTPERGFSFSKTGPLDMRMDIRQNFTAEEWINSADEQTIMEVLKNEGEERNARKIAKTIVKVRGSQRINTTSELSAIIEKTTPRDKNWRHPATRAFQAIRIHVNAEHSQLSGVLPQIVNSLKPGGRMVVIAFHSLEDRMVKNFINADSRYLQNLRAKMPKGLPFDESDFDNLGSNYKANNLQAIGKPTRPSRYEVDNNPRSRSAIMRIAQKRFDGLSKKENKKSIEAN